jgi:hypothetical protein
VVLLDQPVRTNKTVPALLQLMSCSELHRGSDAKQVQGRLLVKAMSKLQSSPTVKDAPAFVFDMMEPERPKVDSRRVGFHQDVCVRSSRLCHSERRSVSA